MKLETQVVSLKLSQKLKALGVKQESLFLWTTNTSPETLWSLDRFEEKFGNPGEGHDEFSAFTAAELGEMLPDEKTNKVRTMRIFGTWFCEVYDYNTPHAALTICAHREVHENEVEARAGMVVFLIENGLITP